MAPDTKPQIGESNLPTLLSTMEPSLHPDTFVFATLPCNTDVPPTLPKQMTFQEAEGTTVITTEEAAKVHNIPYQFRSRMITLNIHSSLEAVGFLAAITTRLALKQMGVNPVSGYHHDHLFVPLGREDEAMNVLHELAKEYTST